MVYPGWILQCQHGWQISELNGLDHWGLLGKSSNWMDLLSWGLLTNNQVGADDFGCRYFGGSICFVKNRLGVTCYWFHMLTMTSRGSQLSDEQLQSSGCARILHACSKESRQNMGIRGDFSVRTGDWCYHKPTTSASKKPSDMILNT